ncbi:DNA-binding response regulator, NarL/FixJ family, contains REC and HTH domains [Nocardia amikacinitolerans]|uniref:DNA-binding response regulator, NarL/FixJ family, contains REC and HTH domains n=1 Tax=Nocardia amikacinitolerans TaxID=756689 RepID=A0A285L2J4_9NOCA|nr:response regulator transcription factor [Nocardia amikacinitolerans]SNY78703.1 DNA-binding response regulator, NarL/FixJ family, contains REC and HTH domains [Nocardia amikacinitolerans]
MVHQFVPDESAAKGGDAAEISGRIQPATLRIVIVSPIRLYRDGLAAVLLALDDVGDVRACERSLDGIDSARRMDADVVLLDMSAVTSTAAARLFTRELPGVSVVALALPETEQSVVACAEAGIVGYVPREGTLDDLIAAVRHTVIGETLCPPMIAGGLMRRVATLAGDQRPHRARFRLTAREREIADQIALGLSNRAIADRLGIELCTVKNHVHNILDKLGAMQRADVARFLMDG